ncbi:MAG: YdeI/OmpD-associated family protein [Chitinophagaceae bacterium]|nr:YdeI/OmpD-associated family protein [Chitinophagaceae bacterium]
MTPTFFAKPSGFREWLIKNHKIASELLVAFYKVGSGKPSMTWSQSVDEALCFGWIDGVRKSIDNDSYQIRFTPRKPSGIWSAVNINKMEALTRLGLMQPAGSASFEKRTEKKSKIYAYEKQEVKFTPTFEKQFKANKKAWDYFETLALSYKQASTNCVMSAKQESTQKKRLHILIADSEAETNQWKNNKYKKQYPQQS